MRLFKLITGGLILLIIGLFIGQNLATFSSNLPFKLDLYIREQVLWQLTLYMLLLIAAFIGFCLGVLLMLKPYFNARRMLMQERQDRKEASSAAAPEIPNEPVTTRSEEKPAEQGDSPGQETSANP